LAHNGHARKAWPVDLNRLEGCLMDLFNLVDAFLNDIEAEARKAEAEAKANGECIDRSEAHKRALDNMMKEEKSK